MSRRDPTIVVDLDNENAVSAAERNIERLQRQRTQIAAAESALAHRQNGARARPRKRPSEVELDLPGRVTLLEAYVREHRADVRLRNEALDDRLASIEADIDVLMDRLLITPTAPSTPTSTPTPKPPRRSWWRWLLRRPPKGGQQMTWINSYALPRCNGTPVVAPQSPGSMGTPTPTAGRTRSTSRP